MFFTQEDLNNLQNKINVEDFYKTYLPDLSQKGRLAWACCPFHNETKASFSVDLTTGIWKCWGGCGYGSIYSFYQKYFNVSFVEAVQQLAEKYEYVLTIDEETCKQQEYKKALRDINNTVNNKFKQNLIQHNEPYNYLTQIRGLSPKIIKDFELGLGLKVLPNKESLKSLDLLRGGENGFYPTFRDDRVTFPLKDENGKIIGFAGRLWVEKDRAKYMYTGDTPLFKKGDYLHGLYEAKKYIKHFNSVILVEGNLDMIKCHQKGIVNTVCIGGVNLSEAQITKLKKYTNTFYVVIEDNAMLKVNTNGFSDLDKMYKDIKEIIPYAKLYVIDLRNKDESKCDADMYLNTHERSDFSALVKHAPIYNEYIINSKLKQINPKNIEEKTACINFLIPKLADIQDYMSRKQYIELVSNKLLIPENDIYRKVKFYNEKKDKKHIEGTTYDSKPVFAQKILLSMCFASNFNNYNVISRIYIKKDRLEPFYRNIFTEFIAPYVLIHRNDDNIDFKEFFNELMYNDTISDLIKKSITDIYMKTEQLEDFEDEDLESLVDEQFATLDEYVYTETELDSIDI